ncbi:MAG: alpha/beta hydrolase [Candidatus Obscuribacter sp.]|nr:alpha/beta hydrolase [Candidatus Obscuribacter sp.]MBK9771492.1 alpha/beta hydrolase [Candidatus Obscuribacter sp.]
MDTVRHKTINIEGVNIFYREAGPANAPTILMLHGWPSSSHMFRNLIPLLEDRFHIIAPDYPGFGHSDSPSPSEFTYTFDNISKLIEVLLDTLGITKVSLFVQDYGGPIGFRIAERRPELVRAIVVQNAIAHLEGIAPSLEPLTQYWQDRPGKEESVRNFLKKETTVFQYMHGASQPEKISPDAYVLDQAFLDRPGNDLIQLELFYDYRTNPEKYPEWQRYLRDHKPPMLVIWGENDPFFTKEGALAYSKDNPNAMVKFLNAGHFALEEASEEIATEIRALADRVKAGDYEEATCSLVSSSSHK